MCGIVGYLGKRAPIPVLLKGLERLEYRGYDSSGIAVHGPANNLQLYKAVGKLEQLRKEIHPEDLSSTSSGEIMTGIGHTRWATHGRPSKPNAHPHISGRICLVHNGIIENFIEIKEKLKNQGYEFASETDSEIIASLIDFLLTKNGSLFEAMRQGRSLMDGSYALVVMDLKNQNELYVAKNATPIILGLGRGEFFVASDITAILDYTKDIIVLEDGELARLSESGIEIEADGKSVERSPERITWDPIMAQKGGYRHFMLKEIHEQPEAVTNAFRGRVNFENTTLVLPELEHIQDALQNISRVIIVACGTAWHAALVAHDYIEALSGIPTEVDYGSEFRYRPSTISDRTLFIAISQSGETADTLGSLERAISEGALSIAICNVVASSISRKADAVIYTQAGPEISVASTKAFLTQLTTSFLLALYLGNKHGKISQEEMSKHIRDLIHLPQQLTRVMGLEKQIERIAKKYGRADDMLYLARGPLYPIALEGALKLKEVSYLHAEGYPAGEMKHGPIALVSEETPIVFVLGSEGNNYKKTMSNLREVESRGGQIIVLTEGETEEIKECAWETLTTGKVPIFFQPMVFSVPLQLLAYHIGIHRGTDVDQPRNLAKSVTVE